jgi:hypothetical protein
MEPSQHLTRPSAPAASQIIQTRAAPMPASNPTASASKPRQACVIISKRRRSRRSATTPPYMPSSNDGPDCNAFVTPSARPQWLNSRISQFSTVISTQVPTIETTCATRYHRKLRCRSADSVRLERTFGDGWTTGSRLSVFHFGIASSSKPPADDTAAPLTTFCQQRRSMQRLHALDPLAAGYMIAGTSREWTVPQLQLRRLRTHGPHG